MPDTDDMPNPFEDDERPAGSVPPPRPERPADGDGGSSDDDGQPDDTGADGTLGDRS